MLPRIRTFIRSEQPALAALALVTAISLALLAMTLALGDQRRFEVVRTAPLPGEEVPSTLRGLELTFGAEPDRDSVEAALAIEPAVSATARWRGRTLEFLFTEPLAPGEYTLRLAEGRLGAASERLQEPFALPFRVREPGLAMVLNDEPGIQRLVEVRGGEIVREFARATRIRDYAISPDGSMVAVVTFDGQSPGALLLIETATGDARALVQSPQVNVGAVFWSVDSQALLVVRRDALPGGGEGVPRIWLMRLTGEFVAPIDPEGEPTLTAAWAPDAQAIAYVAPATGNLVVRNLSTQEAVVVGRPRGGAPAWSPDSKLIAFETTPDGQSSGADLLTPIRVRDLSGELDILFGEPGETRLMPRFLDETTLMSLRRTVGPEPRGTELLFESVETGELLRAVLLAPGTDLVQSWDLDPARQRLVYDVRAGANQSVIVMELESGKREVVPFAGERPRWLP